MKNKIDLKQTIHDLLTESTWHGFSSVFKSKLLSIRIFWIFLTLASTSLCSYFIFKNVNEYLNFEIVTSIDIIYETKAEFPAVTLCSTSGFNQSLQSLIIMCRFNNRNCSIDTHFESYDDPMYSLCYRFNSIKNSSPLYTFNGIFYGLQLHLALELKEGDDYGEMEILIHNSSEPPIDLFSKGYYISSGTYNYFEVERLFDSKLDEPYNDCLKDVNDFKLNKTYTRKECLQFCIYLLIVEKSECNCNSDLNMVLSNCIHTWNKVFKPNSTEALIKSCSDKYLTNLQNRNIYTECGNYCPLECDSVSYTFSIYTQDLPSSGPISNNKQSTNNFGNFKTYDEVNRKYVGLLVYYKDLQYTHITQQAKTQFIDLISNIGGIFGLFLGISFLSFAELIEVLFYFICFLFLKFKINKTRVSNFY